MFEIAEYIGIIAFAMSGFFNEAQVEQEKGQQAETARLCKIYTKKTETYKASMRDDQFAKATLNNYVRLETKYCNASHS